MAQWKAFSAILKTKLNSNKMMGQQIQKFIKNSSDLHTSALYQKSNVIRFVCVLERSKQVCLFSQINRIHEEVH